MGNQEQNTGFVEIHKIQKVLTMSNEDLVYISVDDLKDIQASIQTARKIRFNWMSFFLALLSYSIALWISILTSKMPIVETNYVFFAIALTGSAIGLIGWLIMFIRPNNITLTEQLSISKNHIEKVLKSIAK